MFKCFSLFILFAVVGCTNNGAASELKNSTQKITWSEKTAPIFYYGEPIWANPDGNTKTANPWPYILWMQTEAENTCFTPMWKTAYPGEVSRIYDRLYDGVEIGICSNLPNRCFLISEKWTRGPDGDRLNEAEACDPSLSEKDKW